ncbi:transposase [Halopseudomonas sabulinigri]|uniref:DDE-type integrase/transposase/recombinase n=1 Tax=Halopseudomonas sabulinigri TaxID=472181 RepID=A0ABP9ZS55_9GAMM
MDALDKKLINPGRYKVGALVASDDGRTFLIHSINTKVGQVVLTGQYGDSHVYRDHEFRNKVAAGELKLAIVTKDRHDNDARFEPRDLSPSEMKARDERQEYIDVVLKNTATCTWEVIYSKIKKQFSEQRKVPSQRTIERYWNIYKEGLSPNCLAPHYSQRGVHRTLAMDPVVEEIILNTIEDKYCNSSRFSLQDIVYDINQKCDAKSEELDYDLGGVSRRSVSRFISRLNIHKIKGRLSRNTFRLIVRNALSYHNVLEPYARVEVDSTPLDIFVVDDHGNVLGCPTLYAMIDTATMTIVAVHLTIHAPSQVGVLQTLQFAFSPKGELFRQQHSCVNEWPAPADIRTLVMDNGADFHGPMVVKASQHLSMMLEYCQAGAPYQKPFIERFFGTLTTMLIMKLPGAKTSQDKRELHSLEMANKSASLTLDQLNTFIIRWIADTYHVKKNNRLTEKFDGECTPLKALEILSQKYVVFPAPSPEELSDACRRTLDVQLKVTREGINYQGHQYQGEYVSALYKTNSKVTVAACVNPLDCSSIHVYDGLTKKWVVVPHKNPNMPAISFEQAKDIRKRRSKSDLDMSRESEVLNQMQIIVDAHSKKKPKGPLGVNRKAEREILNAQASILATTQQADTTVPTVSPVPTQSATQPHRRKK